MNCAFDKEKLSGYYDGELDAAEKAEVERHIASCSECLRELGELKSAAILVKELPRLRAPRSIADGVRKEIQAVGKVHSFARVRRTVMWAASAAAVLFIGLNVMHFSKPAPEGAVAAKPVSGAPALGRALPSEDAHRAEELDRLPARPAAPEEQAQKLRQDEARRNESADRDRKKTAAPAPFAKGEAEREKAPASKLEEKKPTAVPDPAAPPAPAAEVAKPAPPKPSAAPPPPAPAAPVTAAPAPAPRLEPKPAEPAADTAAPAMKKDGEAQAGSKQKAAEADPAPTHLTLATTQLAKSRPEMAEALKRMGLTLPPPPSAAMVKGVARSGAREETVYTYDLTDAQIARLRAELEKPGTSTLVAGRPEDPVMAQFKRGGMFEEKRKDVASGGAAPAKKFAAADSKVDAPREKEAKETEDGAKALAEGAPAAAAEKPGEPRRKVVLHFLEVPYIPDRQPASDALKK